MPPLVAPSTAGAETTIGPATTEPIAWPGPVVPKEAVPPVAAPPGPPAEVPLVASALTVKPPPASIMPDMPEVWSRALPPVALPPGPKTVPLPPCPPASTSTAVVAKPADVPSAITPSLAVTCAVPAVPSPPRPPEAPPLPPMPFAVTEIDAPPTTRPPKIAERLAFPPVPLPPVPVTVSLPPVPPAWISRPVAAEISEFAPPTATCE